MATGTVSTALREVALFRDLSEHEIEVLSHQIGRRRYARNELIFCQGDPGDGLHIVEEGHVMISRQNPDGDELLLSICEPGEYFGELALFDDEPRSASATAVEDGTTLFLSRKGFHAFLEA